MQISHPMTDAVLFSAAELGSKDDGTVRLAHGFAHKLLDLRLTFAKPMKVNSCCRTPAHNAAVGGAKNSYHLTEGNASKGTCAIDIAILDDEYRHRLVRMATDLGWSVGVYRTFVHLDRRKDYGGNEVVFYGK
jgi:hypothetical protein